jgi:peptide/nickel transport system substrate-binding protein
MPLPRKSHILLALVVAALLIPRPATSQDGIGVIAEGNVYGSENIGSLNPLRCDNPACRRITSLLFPHLIGIDPASGTFAPTGDPMGLAAGWEVATDGTTYTFHLRADLSWSDGTPVTAYDAFYSYLAITSDEIASPYTDPMKDLVRGAAPLDEHTFVVFTSTAVCFALDRLNFPIIPAHVFEPDFAAQTATVFNATDDPLRRFEVWRASLVRGRFAPITRRPFDHDPTVTAGVFEFGTLQTTDYVRLMRDGAQGFAYVDVPDRDTEVTLFLEGDLNFIDNPPYNRRADIRAARDVQIFEAPGLTWDAISFNLADPRYPQNAFDKEGNRVDQGRHPVFGDERVRRAVQLAINVEALMEASVEGDGTVLAANQLPTSWALDPNLAPVAFDPAQARRLLEEAGWKDIDNDGVRECYGCLYARPGEQLSFELTYSYAVPRHEVLSRLIQDQLAQVGFSVNPSGMYEDLMPPLVVREQMYDAYLFQQTESYPIDPDQTDLFTTAGDVLGTGQNTGSYYNPEIERLMTQARTLSGCDYAARAGLYRRIQTILQDEQPYVWLFAPNQMLAARGGVQGFDPYPNAPFWNIQQWIVVR